MAREGWGKRGDVWVRLGLEVGYDLGKMKHPQNFVHIWNLGVDLGAVRRGESGRFIQLNHGEGYIEFSILITIFLYHT